MFSPLTYVALIDEYPTDHTITVTLDAAQILTLSCVLPVALDRWRWQKSLTPDSVWDEIESALSGIIDRVHRTE